MGTNTANSIRDIHLRLLSILFIECKGSKNLMKMKLERKIFVCCEVKLRTSRLSLHTEIENSSARFKPMFEENEIVK